MTDKTACDENCIDCNPGAAHLGETMTIAPGEWTSLDDHGTQIWVYGDQPVDIAFPAQPGPARITFRETDGVTAVYVEAQHVTSLPAEAERAINALVDVLEALGLRPVHSHERNAT